jgi:lysophospholipase L1-like esterase
MILNKTIGLFGRGRARLAPTFRPNRRDPRRSPLQQIVRLGVILLVACFVLTLGVTRTASQGSPQQRRYSAAASEIAYFGRTVRGDTVLWTWPASGLRVAYRGSATVALHFRAENAPDGFSFNRTRMAWYRIDSGPWTQLIIPPNTDADYSLAVPGDTNKHTLDVVKASEGQLTFAGIALDAGGQLAKPVLPAHRIEIVGDSTSAGFRVYGPGTHSAVQNHDARATYGWLLGDWLDAEVRLIAFSGAGLVHNFGTSAAESQPMPTYYPYLHRDMTIPNDWSWQPEVVIVNLGTNDTTPPGWTPFQPFQFAYISFLSMLRNDNPKALIIALRPFGTDYGAVHIYPNQIQAAVDALRTAGDNRVVYLDTAGWLGGGDFTDGVHPNAQGNGKAAKQLAPFVQSWLQPAPLAIAPTPASARP